MGQVCCQSTFLALHEVQFSDDLVEATPKNVEDRLFRRVDHFGMPMELKLGSAEQKAALRRQKSSGKVSLKFLKPRPVEAAMRFCQQVQACGVLLTGSKTHTSKEPAALYVSGRWCQQSPCCLAPGHNLKQPWHAVTGAAARTADGVHRHLRTKVLKPSTSSLMESQRQRNVFFDPAA